MSNSCAIRHCLHSAFGIAAEFLFSYRWRMKLTMSSKPIALVLAFLLLSVIHAFADDARVVHDSASSPVEAPRINILVHPITLASSLMVLDQGSTLPLTLYLTIEREFMKSESWIIAPNVWHRTINAEQNYWINNTELNVGYRKYTNGERHQGFYVQGTIGGYDVRYQTDDDDGKGNGQMVSALCYIGGKWKSDHFSIEIDMGAGLRYNISLHSLYKGLVFPGMYPYVFDVNFAMGANF